MTKTGNRAPTRAECEVCGSDTDALYRSSNGFYECPACRAFSPDADTVDELTPGLTAPAAIECARTVVEKVEAMLEVVGQLSADDRQWRDMRRLRGRLEQCRVVLRPLIPPRKTR